MFDAAEIVVFGFTWVTITYDLFQMVMIVINYADIVENISNNVFNKDHN